MTPRSAGKINTEDLEPPADDAASLAPRRNVRLSRAADDNSSVAGSRRLELATGCLEQPPPAQRPDHRIQATTRPRRLDRPCVMNRAPNLDDDGPNPLPPALDTAAASSRHSAVVPDDEPVKVARSSTRIVGQCQAPIVRRLARTRRRQGNRHHGCTRRARAPVDARRRLAGSAGDHSRIVRADRRERSRRMRTALRSRRPGALVAPRRRVADRSTNPPGDADSAQSTDSPAINGASSTAGRPTWRELAHNQSEVPLDESIRRAAGDAPSGDRGVVTLTSNAAEAKPGLSRLLGGIAAAG